MAEPKKVTRQFMVEISGVRPEGMPDDKILDEGTIWALIARLFADRGSDMYSSGFRVVSNLSVKEIK